MAQATAPLLGSTWWANENDGSGEPDRTPHLHDHASPVPGSATDDGTRRETALYRSIWSWRTRQPLGIAQGRNKVIVQGTTGSTFKFGVVNVT